jgi:hypothetical protein
MIKKEIFIGLCVGLVANSIGLVLAALFLGNGDDIEMTLKQAHNQGVFGKLVTIGAILNLVVFFIFIKKKQDYRARGVLLATVLVAISTFLLNLY